MKHIQNTSRLSRHGFTLIELVVVVLILGIIAAVAAPKMFDVAGDARDNGLRQTLSILRTAIELHKAQNGALPGADGSQTTFKSDLAPYLRGSFPAGPVGPAEGNSNVFMSNSGTMNGSPTPTKAWKYQYPTGEFIFNYNGLSNDGVTTYGEF
jgi:general secretion pathway protein G